MIHRHPGDRATRPYEYPMSKGTLTRPALAEFGFGAPSAADAAEG